MILPFSKVLKDKNLFGQHFSGESWNWWKEKWKEIEATQAREFWLCKGRGSGGSRMLSAKAVHSCLFEDWEKYLSVGETATALVLASDKRQAGETFSYASGLVNETEAIKGMVIRETQSEIEFSNRTRIEVRSADYRKVRGYSLCFCGLDEMAFWEDSSSGSNPSSQVYNALLPALGRLPNSFLMAISTPWSASSFFGEMINKYRDGKDSEIYCVIADTLTCNPTFSKKIIERAYERDFIEADSEYGAKFRSDLEPFVSSTVVGACTAKGRYELAPLPEVSYSAFCDPSGGRNDSFTLGISHSANGIAVLDCLRERCPPFSPESVVQEFAQTCKLYRCHEVTGDKYAGEWPSDQFSKYNIRYVPSERNKSEIYLETLPLLNSERVELLDIEKLRAQLLGLERRTRSGGRDTIDHQPNAHDDLCNSALGSLLKTVSFISVEASRRAINSARTEDFISGHNVYAKDFKSNKRPNYGSKFDSFHSRERK